MRIKKTEQSIGLVGKITNSESTSTTDTYSCEYVNNKISNLTPIVLYQGTGTTGSIPLNDSALNYNFLIVYWQTTYNGTRRGVSLAPNNQLFTLFSLDVDVDTYTNVYTNCALYSISGSSFNLVLAKNYSGTDTNIFFIDKIVGYK